MAYHLIRLANNYKLSPSQCHDRLREIQAILDQDLYATFIASEQYQRHLVHCGLLSLEELDDIIETRRKTTAAIRRVRRLLTS